MLSLIYAFSFMDRPLASVLVASISAEFDLSDTQLGRLSGLAFAFLLGVTALGGTVNNYWMLLLGRPGAGVGEASASPSVILDYLHANERSLAFVIFVAGTSLGVMAGLVLGGYVTEHYSWRIAFIVAGLAGLFVVYTVSTWTPILLRNFETGKTEVSIGPKYVAVQS